MKHRSHWLAGLTGTALALIVAATAFAYAAEVAGAVTVAGPTGTITCGVPLTLSATVLDAASKPIEGQPVDWAIATSPSTSDAINTTPTTTDASGVATTTVTLACVAGDRTVTATADSITGQMVLGLSVSGLPRTSTVSGGLFGGDLPIGTLLAFMAMIVGAGLILRRVALSPR